MNVQKRSEPCPHCHSFRTHDYSCPKSKFNVPIYNSTVSWEKMDIEKKTGSQVSHRDIIRSFR